MSARNAATMRPMQFGIWLPVYGGWLRTYDQPAAPDVPACLAIAQQAEALGFDFLYASENLLNCIHGPAAAVADAWSMLAAIAATTSKVGLCGAVKPGFRSPFLVARMLDTLSKIAGRRLSMNIVCGWWREEFELSKVDWLDHGGRYDRAEAFIRTIHDLFRPSVDLDGRGRRCHPNSGLCPGRTGRSRATGSTTTRCPRFGSRGFPPCRPHGGGMGGLPVRQRHGGRVPGPAHRDGASGGEPLGRKLSIAINAYVIATDEPAEARARLRKLMARRNPETIAFFRSLIDEFGATAWANLTEEEMVDSNAGFASGLIGSFGEIRDRIAVLADLGVDRIVCQFDDPMRDAGPFMKQVVRHLVATSATAD